MADALKEMFNLPFYKKFAAEFSKADRAFNAEKFIKEVTTGIDELSLNQRMRNTSVVLKKYLPYNYKKQISICKKVIPNIPRGYVTLVFPDFVGLHGRDNFEESMEALKFFTSFGSSEFAVREYLKLDFKKAIPFMETWAEDKNPHVRRLASEGSRPRLPWSFKLDEVIKNPKSTAKILEKLNADEELYVRKSVANHLNDISKDNADYMLQTISKWNKQNRHTAWIVKHASRSLIKKGNAESLAVFDFEKNVKVAIEDFKLKKEKVKLGEELQFEFYLVSGKKIPQKLVVDYIIHYVKKEGGLSPKVFKLKEITLNASETIHLSKKQLLKDFTTRKHYTGKHKLQIQVNGKVMGEKVFELVR